MQNVNIETRILLIEPEKIFGAAIKSYIESFGNYCVTHISNITQNTSSLITNIPNKFHITVFCDSKSNSIPFSEFQSLQNESDRNPVLVITEQEDQEDCFYYFFNGCKGCIRRSDEAEVLKFAIEEINATGYYRNDIFFSSISRLKNSYPASAKYGQILANLPQKQKLFLKLVCDDQEYMYTEIAEKMNISTRAVDKCRRLLFDKLQVKSKTGLVIFIYKNKLDYLLA